MACRCLFFSRVHFSFVILNVHHMWDSDIFLQFEMLNFVFIDSHDRNLCLTYSDVALWGLIWIQPTFYLYNAIHNTNCFTAALFQYKKCVCQRNVHMTVVYSYNIIHVMWLVKAMHSFKQIQQTC